MKVKKGHAVLSASLALKAICLMVKFNNEHLSLDAQEYIISAYTIMIVLDAIALFLYMKESKKLYNAIKTEKILNGIFSVLIFISLFICSICDAGAFESKSMNNVFLSASLIFSVLVIVLSIIARSKKITINELYM